MVIVHLDRYCWFMSVLIVLIVNEKNLVRGRESACDRLVRLRWFRVSTLRHSVCRRVEDCRVSGIIPLWSGYGGGGSSGSAGSGGRAGRRAGFAGRDGVGGASACARCGDGVGGSRLGEGFSYGCHCFCSSNLRLDILY
jgi:hypothetical protein